ncbi:MAG: Ig-like domain-containing protein [Armatimonadota bacterium]|nr:Ig-like domain-containing protein [bacterium]
MIKRELPAFLVLFALTAIGANAQDVPPPAPPSIPAASRPGMPMLQPGARPLMVGPSDATQFSKVIKGKIVLMAMITKDVQAASVDFQLDGKQIGSANTRPYRFEIDTETIPDGEHIIKAIGHDESGKDVWNASTKAQVANKVNPTPISSQNNPPAALAPQMPSQPALPVTNAQHTPVPGQSAAFENYNSPKYGFSVKYPTGWGVKDVTAGIKGKEAGEFWVAFGSAPIVVNIHGKKMKPGTDPDKFAKFNPYVQKWQRTTVLGSPAFITTDGTPDVKRVIHRLIMLKNGTAWMCNCIDTTGKSASDSSKILDDVVNSLQITQ